MLKFAKITTVDNEPVAGATDNAISSDWAATVDLADLHSGAAPVGYVPVADGFGDVSWASVVNVIDGGDANAVYGGAMVFDGGTA